VPAVWLRHRQIVSVSPKMADIFAGIRIHDQDAPVAVAVGNIERLVAGSTTMSADDTLRSTVEAAIGVVAAGLWACRRCAS
jgi:hypothetical protein